MRSEPGRDTRPPSDARHGEPRGKRDYDSFARASIPTRRLDTIDSLAAHHDTSAVRELRTRVERWPEGARDVSFALFRRWGSAVQRGDSVGAAEALRRVRTIAEILGAMNADQTVLLAVRTLETRPRDRQHLAALARAHVEFADGLAENFTWAQNDAVAALARAEPSLRDAGSPLAQWAALYRGAAEIFRGHYAIADRLLHDVRRTAGPDQPAVVGKALWLLGLSQLLRGAYRMSRTSATAKRGRSSRKRASQRTSAPSPISWRRGSNSQDRSPLESARRCSGFGSSRRFAGHPTSIATYGPLPRTRVPTA